MKPTGSRPSLVPCRKDVAHSDGRCPPGYPEAPFWHGRRRLGSCGAVWDVPGPSRGAERCGCPVPRPRGAPVVETRSRTGKGARGHPGVVLYSYDYFLTPLLRRLSWTSVPPGRAPHLGRPSRDERWGKTRRKPLKTLRMLPLRTSRGLQHDSSPNQRLLPRPRAERAETPLFVGRDFSGFVAFLPPGPRTPASPPAAAL